MQRSHCVTVVKRVATRRGQRFETLANFRMTLPLSFPNNVNIALLFPLQQPRRYGCVNTNQDTRVESFADGLEVHYEATELSTMGLMTRFDAAILRSTPQRYT